MPHPAALDFLPNWWPETTDPAAFDGLLAGWTRVCGWASSGFLWPADGTHAIVKVVKGSMVSDAVPPTEAADAAHRIRSGETTAHYPLAGGGARVFAPVVPTGHPAGLLWADKPAAQPWSDVDRSYLALTAKTVARSPALSHVIGPVLDPERLFQRLGDAAVIAGRMAHDFDNILTGIIGFADLTGPMLAPGSQPASFVAEIARVGQRGIVFTQQLHQLSRSGQTKPNPGTVAAAVAKEEARLKPAMHPALRVEKDVPANTPAVALEAAPLQTVLGHLLENAVEACPQGGSVNLTARPVDLTEADVRGYLGRAGVGPHLLVTITDGGTGIKPEVRRRLFAEPFYTTKVRHRGLGLAIVYRILCAHRGGIQIDAVPPPGTGTQVRVVLPLAAASRPPAHAATVSATTVGG